MFNFSIKMDHHLGASLEEQIEACSRLLINNIEIDGTNLAELSGREIESMRNLLIQKNKKIVLLDCDFTHYNVDQINLLFRKAHLLSVENVNITRWQAGESENVAALESLLAEVMPIARSYGIGVTLENRRASSLSDEVAIAALFQKFKEYLPGLVFNPMEFAAEKRHPFFHVFYNSRLKPCICFLRVNDGLFINGSPALPAEGNAEIKELVSALLARSFKGYFSFHPYLPEMDINLYCDVIERFKRLLLSM